MEVTTRHTTRGWLKPKRGALYAGVSLKVFYCWIKNGLRHVRLDNGRILTKYDWIDEFLEGFEAKYLAQELVEELTKGLS